MKPALMLIDLQQDFFHREPRIARADRLIERCARLLEVCRASAIPVLHVHTVVSADGSDRMPHWKRDGTWICVAGTPGCEPPEPLRPRPDEPVFTKRFYSAFGNPALDAALHAAGTDLLIVAGIYLHACVQASVLDAYQRGYTVWVAADACACQDSMQETVSRAFLDGRAAELVEVREMEARLGLLR